MWEIEFESGLVLFGDEEYCREVVEELRYNGRSVVYCGPKRI